jgi:hypothetical protein
VSEFEWFRRLAAVPGSPDLGRGLRAEVADPAWFLGRQWQLGEHQGEDASSPALVEIDVSHLPLHDPEQPTRDPTVVPAQALLESEHDAWWTIGRRIRLGRAADALLGALPASDRAALTFDGLAPPYDAFSRGLDGRKVHRAGLLAGDPIWSEVPPAPPERWRSDELVYAARFTAGGSGLRADRHGGGDVDWYSVDADALPAIPLDQHARRQVLASRMRYPGAPLPRWWEIEDVGVDIGSFPPDRSHVATMLLVDLVAGHGDEWFSFPVPAPTDPSVAGIGVVVTVHQARVRDSFDQWWPLDTPPGRGDPIPPGGAAPWSLFRTTGLDRSSLVLWPTAVTPIHGPVLDEALLGVDEDANLLWAVELRADGAHLATGPDVLEALAEVTPTGTRRFDYLPSTTLPPHWHPYRIESRSQLRWFVQGLVADLTVRPPATRPGPRSPLLSGTPDGTPGHLLTPAAVPNAGVGLERRFVLARDTTGQPVLWLQRRRIPALNGPVSHLRFDVFAEAKQ